MIITTVYWLVDTRLVARKRGWPIGEPFYCGKTDRDPLDAVAAMAYLSTTVAKRIKACGDRLRIHVMAEMTPTRNEYVTYRRAVERLRHLNPDGCLNGTIGAPKRENVARVDMAQMSKRHVAAAKRMLREERERRVRERLAR